MSQNRNTKNKKQTPQKKWLHPAIAAAAVIVVVLVVISQNPAAGQNAAPTQPIAQSAQADASEQPVGSVEGITINKKDITSAATFIPYQSGGTKMEIIAVRADDGTVRTSLNTCQVCWDSGRGYYKQQGNELVCQNCGNRFNINSIEKIKNGCNPVPITGDEKTESVDTIAISADTLALYKKYFQK